MTEIEILFNFAMSLYKQNEKEKLKEAIKLFTSVAEYDTPSGELYSQAHYFAGKCFEKLEKYHEAFAHFERACSCNKPDVFAINSLGICYYSGIGIELDYNMAYACFSKAAKLGYDRAQYNAGLCHYYKEIEGKSYEKAFNYFLSAHNQKHLNSTEMVALCYANGKGVEKSFEKAYEYILLADQKKDSVKNSLIEYSAKTGRLKEAKNYIDDILKTEDSSSSLFKNAKKQLKEIDSNLIPKALEQDLCMEPNSFPNINYLTEKYGSFDKEFIYDTAIAKENLGEIKLAIQFYVIAAASGSKKALYTLNNMAVTDTLYFSNIMDYSGEEKGNG